MPVKPTLFSRVSIGWWNSGKSLVDMDPADSGPVFSVMGESAYGAINATSTASFGGAATLQSTLTVRGDTTFSSGIAVGGGNELQILSAGTAAVSLGAIAPLESSSVQTFAVSGLSRGDYLGVTIDSNYPNTAANRDVTMMWSSSSTVGEAHIWGVNSTLTSVTPTAGTYLRWLRVKAGNYPAA